MGQEPIHQGFASWSAAGMNTGIFGQNLDAGGVIDRRIYRFAVDLNGGFGSQPSSDLARLTDAEPLRLAEARLMWIPEDYCRTRRDVLKSAAAGAVFAALPKWFVEGRTSSAFANEN